MNDAGKPFARSVSELKRECSELVGAQILRVLIVAQLGRELEPMLVVLAEPRQRVHRLRRRRGHVDVHRRVAAEREALHAGRAVGEARIHAHRPVRQIDERIAVEPHPIDADLRLTQHAEAVIAGVLGLDPAVPIHPLAAVRRQLGARQTRRILAVPRSIEGDVHCLTRRRRRRRPVQRAEEQGVVAETRARDSTDARRNIVPSENVQQVLDGIL